ncbi:MAG: tandem-95 repeat protein [Fuerstiella sp.]|nr:tandem-95 repeat protein [Fuerstiella sp.]
MYFRSWLFSLRANIPRRSTQKRRRRSASVGAPAAELDVLETRCLLSSISLVNGVDGYAGTVDTWIDGSRSSKNYGASSTLEIDGNSGVEQTLLRFEDIFGNSVGQIPAGSAIKSATLEIYVSNRGHDPNMHRLLTEWSEADTWSSLNHGLQISSDVVAVPDASFSGAKGFVSIDVKSSLQEWSNDPTLNLGWAFLPTGTNGVGFRSSEYSDHSVRPRLNVTTDESVAVVNFAPVANDDSVATEIETEVTFNVLNNDSDANGDMLSVAIHPSSGDLIVGEPSHGQASVESDGTVTYTPEPDFVGTDSFTYMATDGSQFSNTAIATVTVSPPIFAAAYQDGIDDYTGTVDTWIDGSRPDKNFGTYSSLEIDGDSGVEQTFMRFEDIFGHRAGQIAAGSTIKSATLDLDVSNPGHDPTLHHLLAAWSEDDTWNSLVNGLAGTDVGTSLDPQVTVIENSNHVLVDVTSSLQLWSDNPAANLGWAFLPTGTNGVGFSSSEKSSVTDRPKLIVEYTSHGLPPANTAPVALDDLATTSEDTAITIDVLANDSDADSDSLTPSIVSQPAKGTTRVNANGTITYTPKANFNGSESFTYRVFDGTTNSAVAKVSLTVTAVNDAPNVVIDSFATNFEAVLNVPASSGVLANDSDVDGDTLTASLVTGPSDGTLVLNENGSFNYTPDTLFDGTDSFTYSASDGTTSTQATVTIVVAPAEPIALPAFPGAEGFGTETIGGRGGAVIKVTNTNDSGPGSLRDALENVSGPRIVVFDTGGLITLSDSIKIRDPFVTIAGQTAPGDGIAIRSAPLIVATHDVIIRNVRFRVGDLADGSPSTSRDGITISTSYATTDVYNVVVDHSSVAWGVDENISTWTASGKSLKTRDITIQRSITAEALENSIHIDEGDSSPGPHSMGALLGRDGTNVSFHHNLLAHNQDRNPRISGIVGAEVVNNVIYNWGDGPVKISDHENVVHVLNNYFRPGADSADRDIQFTNGSIDAGTRIYVSGNYVDPIPGQTRNVDSNEARDTDSEDDLIVRYAPGWSDATPPSYRALVKQFDSPLSTVHTAQDVYSAVLDDVGATLPFHDSVDVRILGEVVSRSGGVIDSQNERGGWQTYVAGTPLPDLDGDGMPDSWEASQGLNSAVDDSALDADGDGYSNIENYINGLFVSSPSENVAPVANADSASTEINTAMIISVLSNDTDANGDILSFDQIVSNPSNGQVIVNASGTVTYTPDTDFLGGDSFTYTATDGVLSSNAATVSITVAPPNNVPLANPDSTTTDEDTDIIIDVLANDTDADGQLLTPSIVTQPENGAATVNVNGAITYSPDEDFNGTDSFTYRASDGIDDSIPATVSLTVTAVNDAPTAVADSYSVVFDSVLNVAAADGVLANDSDAEGAAITASLVSGTTDGTIVFNANGSFEYTPNAAFIGTDSFTYSASDGTTSQQVAATIIVTPPEPTLPHFHNHSMRDEYLAALALVDYAAVTHSAISSGAWSDASTWYGGVVPGENANVWIREGLTVTVDSLETAIIRTLRVDGTLLFSSSQDSQLRADTVVVTSIGLFEMGTVTAPIEPGVTARLKIADRGAIDRVWDPGALSRGLIVQGAIRIHGTETASFVEMARAPRAGDTSIQLTAIPAGWNVGDQIVIADTQTAVRREEVRTILDIVSDVTTGDVLLVVD